MTTVLKRVVIRLIILAAVGGLLYGITVVDFSGEQKHFRVDAAAVRVEVQPDASLRVTERLTYDSRATSRAPTATSCWRRESAPGT